MNKIDILHLSDLHLDSSNHRDLDIVLEALLQDLGSLKKNEKVSPDLVVFSGDLVKNGDIEENYTIVHSAFLDPLFKTLEIDQNRFFISPGNHDIQMSQIDEIYELGLEQKLVDRTEVNSFLDSLNKNAEPFRRFSNFSKFKNRINSNYNLTNNILYSTYFAELKEVSVGLACMNSAWRASGKPNDFDRGRLLIGERQVDDAVKDIRDARIKIAVIHHPFEYLKGFDHPVVKRRILTEFDIILMGHNHSPEPELSITGDRVLVNRAGCIYQSRDCYIGYSIVRLRIKDQQIDVIERQYYDDRRAFDKALHYSPEGERTYPFDLLRNKAFLPVPFAERDSLHSVLISSSNSRLLSSIADSQAPKDIRQIFVEPPMASDPEYYTQAKAADGKKDIQYFTLNQLIGSGENLLIVGNKESGKTILLHQISLQVLDSEDALVARLPFFINYKDLPKGPRAIEKKLHDYVFDSSVELNVEDNLRSGKCLLLFDDFNREKGKELERLNNFISMHPNNRYIFVMDEDIYKTLELNDMPDLGIKYKCIHIHSFTAERTRKLVQNWFKNMNVDVEEIFEKTMENIWKIKVPRTPFIISLMLWILEIQGNYVPINKASLIEKFVEILLEKLNIHERTYRSLDYRNKEHYLSSIAEKMVDEGKYYFSRLELERATLEYFDRKGLRVSISPLIEYFLKKGILMEEKEIIYFKYKSFCEYFIARRMIDDKSFYEKIIKVENFLGFENEIDYMTGLQRNNSNLLSLLRQRLEESFRALNVNIGLELFDSIKIQRSILESDEKEAVISRFKSSVMDEGERHKMLDQMYPSEAKDGRKIERVAYTDYKTMLMSNLTLYSKVVRNCELIDDLEFKRQSVAKCMESYANLMLTAMVVAENTLKDRPGGKYGDELNYFVKIIIPLVFPYQIYINLGSEKLEKLIDDGIRDSKNPTLIKMLYIMLYGDLKLQGYLDRVRTFVEEIKHNKYILDIIFHKLLIYYMFRKMEKQERKQVEIMVGDIWVHINGTGNRAIDGRNRSKFIYELNLWYLRNLYLIRATLDNV